jgi:hypothetical protein
MQAPFVRSLAHKAANLAKSLDRRPVIGNVIAGLASRSEYLRFLVGTYHYVSWSGRLLAETAEGLRRAGRYPSLVELLTAKSAEESPHDRWLLDDIAGCRASADQARASTANLAVLAYVAWSRALADAGSPAYLGAAYMLEGISFRRAGIAAARLRARAKIAGIDRAVSFLEGHGDADVAHIATLERALCVVDDPLHQAEILASADVLSSLYPRFFATAPL